MDRPLRMGLDIGSTTVKLVLLDGDEIRYETYRRHHADVAGELTEVFADVLAQFPQVSVHGAVTGSGGMGVSQALRLPFVQEVVAGTAAVQRRDPDADVVVELGGEDAKITYLHPTPEQRMNGTCAGGTGAFIDQMATLLGTDAGGLDALAADHHTLYPIASRCGVFAKSDLQPLLNDGAAHTDLAASVFAAVATQTISGLACGRPIRGNVLLLGGPLHFLPELREAYRRALGEQARCRTPERAQLYVALGAALLTDSPATPLQQIAEAAGRVRNRLGGAHRLRPLFADEEERALFDSRHAQAVIPRARLETARGECFLGIDAGSTTLKAVLLDASRRLLFSHYGGNDGDPVGHSVSLLTRLHESMPPAARIARTCVTGYGEGLVKAALRAEDGEVETMAHYRAAEYLAPGVTSVIDIGGQDMKYLRISNGAIDSIAVNEACSSGCGSFLSTFAETMGSDVRAFAASAVAATSPVDLGSRCTVFMNSSVKQAQKEGAAPGDIAAGLSYSVVRNALYKVIKLTDPDQLGERVVVQGGTFLNDAVLRAFELLTGREVVRPDIAGLMGAFGAALTAQRRHDGAAAGSDVSTTPTPLRTLPELRAFEVTTHHDDCRLCQNHCRRTVSTFEDGRAYVTGNRCERGESLTRTTGRRRKSELPNLVEEKYQRLFAYRRLTHAQAPRGDIGIPRALNLYENYPLWFTILSSLGYRVIVSGRSSHESFGRGIASIPSENVCYPAKLAHGHVEDLVQRGIRRIFYPCIRFEQKFDPAADMNFNCPVVASYPEVITNNVESLRRDGVRMITPFLNLADGATLARRLAETFADDGVTLAEAQQAVEAGFTEDRAVKDDIAAMGQRALEFMEHTGTPGIVLAGRPYHADPHINHGIPEMINSLGMAVLTEDAVAPQGAKLLRRPLRVRDQWAYHSRLYAAAAFVASRDDLELVQLTSFGCGLDAITSDQVGDILRARDRLHTLVKIDEVTNLGAARIRLRSLQAAAVERAGRERTSTSDAASFATFTAKARQEHTILMPTIAPFQSRLMTSALRGSGYRVHLLEHASRQDVETGLRHVNNDSCVPAVLVIGQLLAALRSGEFDPDRASVLLPQTGGMCRATNYVALARKALVDAGLGHVPVLAVSVGGVERHEGFSVSLPLIRRIVRALVIGDLLQTVVLRTRPYERDPGSADALYRAWNDLAEQFLDGTPRSRGRRLGYRRIIEGIVADFDALPLRETDRRPRVGVVGEILVKFHPDANNRVVEAIEDLGCEAVLPGVLGFVHYALHTGDFNHATFGTDGTARHLKKVLAAAISREETPAHRALRASARFTAPQPIADLADAASSIVSLGNQAGEGWYLVGEMVDMITSGIPNIVCVQPFGCLPNHVTGKGVFGRLRQLHPQTNVVGVDYDPGASEVNQLNRIRLMISTALSADGSALAPASVDVPQDAHGCGARRTAPAGVLA